MTFVSFYFLLFLAATAVIYFIVPVRTRWVVLLAASLLFYAKAGLTYLPFMLGTALLTYAGARAISGIHEKAAAAMASASSKEEKKTVRRRDKQASRRVMWIVVLLVIAYLFYTKFAKKILALVQTSAAGENPALMIIVPLGISYYTFSTVGYVLDVYWKRYPAEKSFFRYLLYVCYFPHILQGPIARYDKLGVQFREPHYFDYRRVCFGVQLILWGFFKKLVIADRFSPFITNVLADYQNASGMLLFFTMVMYAIQLYADFSGCVDMARGMSQIFGIEIEQNFAQPYFAISVEDFWRRWHITLGAWFRDYLCMPVSVSGFVKKLSRSFRKKFGPVAGQNATTICALIAVWLATGLWHGTGWNYMLWALWQGGIITLSVILKPVYPKMLRFLHFDSSSPEFHLFRILRTFLLCGIVPRTIVKAPTLGAAAVIFKKMITRPSPGAFRHTVFQYGVGKMEFFLGFSGIFLLFLTSVMKERGWSIREHIAGRNIIFRWSIYLFLFFFVVLFGKYGPGYNAASFIYMGF